MFAESVDVVFFGVERWSGGCELAVPRVLLDARPDHVGDEPQPTIGPVRVLLLVERLLPSAVACGSGRQKGGKQGDHLDTRLTEALQKLARERINHLADQRLGPRIELLTENLRVGGH